MASKKVADSKQLETTGRITKGITVEWSNETGLHINVPPKFVLNNEFGKTLGVIGGMGRTAKGNYQLMPSGFEMGDGKVMLLKLEAVVPHKARTEKQTSNAYSENAEFEI